MIRANIQEIPGIGKTWFFALHKFSPQRKEAFSISYHRNASARLPAEMESEIEKSLLREEEIVEPPDLPGSG